MFLILPKSLRDPTCSLFLNFSRGCRLWIWICWGQVQILEYVCADFIISIFLKRLEWGRISVLIWVHFSMKNHQNETLKIIFGPQTLQICLAVSVGFFFFILKTHIIFWIFTFSSSILGTWDRILNHDLHTFLSEIRMTDEGTFNLVISVCV